MKRITILIIISAIVLSAKAQYTITLQGNQTVEEGSSNTYFAIWRSTDTGEIVSPPYGPGPWTPPAGTYFWTTNPVGAGTISLQSLLQLNMTWNTAGIIKLEYYYTTSNNSYYASLDINVSPKTPGGGFALSYPNCGSTVITRTGTPPSDRDWYWQTSASGTSTALGAASAITQTTTGNLYYLRARLKVSPNTWSVNTLPVGSITVHTAAVDAPSIPVNVVRFGTGNVTPAVGSITGATGTRWYNSGGTTLLATVTGFGYATSISANTIYQVSSMAGGCESSGKIQVSASIEPLPQVISTSAVINLNKPVTLSLSSSFDTYDWRTVNLQKMGTSSQLSTNQPGSYIVSITKAGVTGSYTTPPFVLTAGVLASTQDENYIISNMVMIDNIKNVNDISSLAIGNKAQTIKYYDGLGRAIQVVNTQGSPSKNDIVQPVQYDQYGRESRQFLPFVSGDDGWNKKTATSNNSVYTSSLQYAFYTNGADDKIADDINPYADIIYEPSPLNRVIEQGASGLNWQPDNTNSYSSMDRTVKHDYSYNGESEVVLFTYDATTGLVDAGNGVINYYVVNQLHANKTKDEHGNEVIEYIDKEGHTVCKKVQYGTDTTTTAKLYASTYYIYNDMGQLVVVLPPEGVKALVPSSN